MTFANICVWGGGVGWGGVGGSHEGWGGTAQPCGAQFRVVVVLVAGGLLNAHAHGLNQDVTLADPLRNVIVYRGGWGGGLMFGMAKCGAQNIWRLFLNPPPPRNPPSPDVRPVPQGGGGRS